MLGIMPAQYYDLTSTETLALIKGQQNKELASLRQTRRLATLLRNAHFKGSESETEYMPLPGDVEMRQETSYETAVKQAYAIRDAFEGEIYFEPNEP